MSMIHKMIGLGVVIVAAIVGISLYLSPDDIKDCSAPGDGRCQKADAIIVVSGGDTNARTDESIKLYKDGWTSSIIMSGAAADKSGPSNARQMYKRAVENNIPSDALIREEVSETTKQNAIEVNKILTKRGFKRVILVTSGYHMRRTLLEFQAQLTDITVLSHPVSQDKHWSSIWWLTPWGWWLAIGELVKIAVFAVGGSH